MKRSVLATISGTLRPVDLDHTASLAFDGDTIAGFEDLGPLGEGGMGEVRRVRDPDLKRVMAMKILRSPLLKEPAALARFIAEAQATAQLTHPSIVPVHELGRLDDGRVWFTMREVKGRTLGAMIDEVHAASAGERWNESSSGWTFRRLMERFHGACEGVAYAHHRGVVHRDLKPDNIMVGAYGEVLVLDWGLAKIRGHEDLDGAVVTTRTEDDAHKTRMGTVAGTPAYMPPEQARGEVEAIGTRSDVYSLGAILYEILSGRAPYEGSSWRAVIRQVLAFAPDPPGRVAGPADTFTMDRMHFDEVEASSGPPLPDELVQACERAMARDPEDRHEDASAFADDILSWLDGSRKVEQAMALVAESDEVVEDALRWRIRGATRRNSAEKTLEALSPTATEAEKRPAWDMHDAADDFDHQGDMLLVRRLKLLHASLVTQPDLAEAHARLAWIYRHRSVDADNAGDTLRANRERELFNSHLLALPDEHPDRAELQAWFVGDGRVTLVTEPAGAEVELQTFVLEGRRLVAQSRGSLGKTPLREVPIPMGSHLLLIRHGDIVVRYPVKISRQEHWHGIRPPRTTRSPQDTEPTVIALPRTGDDEVYIPAGWFEAAEPSHSPADQLRLWADGFVLRTHPVTRGEYLAFLESLSKEDAEKHLPRRSLGGEEDLPIWRDEDGAIQCRKPEIPVTNISFESAAAYAAWMGDGWRLPSGLEREKAARGVDGRAYPWGNTFDASLTANQHAGLTEPAEAGVFPLDSSVYGARGLAGNVSDWCVNNRWTGPKYPNVKPVPNIQSGDRQVRGGEFSAGEWVAQAWTLRNHPGTTVRPEWGFRLGRDLDEGAE